MNRFDVALTIATIIAVAGMIPIIKEAFKGMTKSEFFKEMFKR